MPDRWPEITFIGTLGTAPQVFTISLDLLLQQNAPVREAVALHTAHPAALQALARLEAEFQRRKNYRQTPFRARCVQENGKSVLDLDNEPAFRLFLQTLFAEIRSAQLQGRAVHLGIAGGRKSMAIGAMVVAQMLFGENDRVWHLFSDMYDADDQRLHATPAQNARLVEVPVLRYAHAAQMLAAFAQLGDAQAAMRLQEQLIAGDTMRRRREFVEHWLTAAEREVVRLACKGLDNAAIARRLHKSERTVQNQLSAVYDKLHEWRGFPVNSSTDRAILIATLSPYFVLRGMTVETG